MNLKISLRRKLWQHGKYTLQKLRGLAEWGASGRVARRWLPGFMSMVMMLAILPMILILLLLGSQAKAATGSEGPRIATATGDCIEDASIGTVAWTTPGNAFSSNDTYASVSVDGTTSRYIKCTNFGFSIPSGVTITGIVVGVERKANSNANGGSQDAAVRAVKGGTIGTTDKSTATIYPIAADTFEDHGSSSDLWGTTWTSSDINASNFGAAISVKKASASGNAHTVTIDTVRITVYYSFNPTFNQSSYGWFNNQDVTGPLYPKTWGGTAGDTGDAVVKTSDGGIAIAGSTASYGGGFQNAFLAKYDSSGVLSWSRTWGDSASNDYANGIVQTSDGGYAITGTTDVGVDASELFVAKFNSAGTLVWDKTWGGNLGSNDSNGEDIAELADGNIVVVGTTSAFGSGGYDIFIARYSSSGTLNFDTTLGGTLGDFGGDITSTADGGYAVTGSTASYGSGGSDAFIAKYSSTNILSWNKTCGGTNVEDGYGIIQVSDGGFAITGTTASYGDTPGDDVFLARYTSAGVLSWSRTWGGVLGSTDNGRSLVETSDGGFAVGGMTYGFTASPEMALVKYTSTGTFSWSRSWGGTGYDRTNSIVEMSDSSLISVGYTDSYGAGNTDAIIVRHDSSGNISGCSSPMCQTPGSPMTSSPTAGTTTPTVSTTNPTATETDPSVTPTSPTASESVLLSPAINVGSQLAATNTAATALVEQSIFRLRMTLHVATDPAIGGSNFPFKLQYAARGTDNVCDTTFTDEIYADVTSSTPIAFGDNAVAGDGSSLIANANDPVHSGHSNVLQEYNEGNNTATVNTIAAGSDGLWDFALKDNGAPASTAYCFRMVTSAGAQLSGGYTVVPQITTLPPNFSQENYRWFKGQDAVPNNTFVQAWGGAGADYGYSTVQTSDGGYAVTGQTASYGAGSDDMFLAKYDYSGTLTWSKTWGGTGSDYGNTVIQTSDGGYAVTGQTASYGAGSNDMFLAKYDSSGGLTWSKTWGGTSSDSGESVIQTSEGGFAVTGATSSYGAGVSDMFLAFYSPSGTLTSSQTWGGTGNDYGSAVVKTAEGGYAVVGRQYSYGDTTNGDVFLAHYDSTGNLSWSRVWGGTAGNDWGTEMQQTSDGGFVITGYTTTHGAGSGDAFLVKYDSTGTLSWSKTWGGTGADYGRSVIQSSDGSYVVTGYTASFGAGSNDMFLAKFDSTGSLVWNKTWGGTNVEYGNSLVQTSDGGYAVAGQTTSLGAGSNDMFLAKYDGTGTLIGCTSTMCQSPSATVGTPTPTTSSPSATTSSPSPSTSTPSPSTSSPSPTVTPITGHVTYGKLLGSTAADSINSMSKTTDGGYVITGQTSNYGTVGGDVYISKFAPDGTIEWTRTWGGPSADEGWDVIQTADGGYAVTGTTFLGIGSEDVMLLKYDSAGTLSWNSAWGTSNTEVGRALVQTTDGGYAVVGYANESLTGMNTLIVKFGSDGSFGWKNTIDDEDNGTERGYDIIETSNGNIIISGEYELGITSQEYVQIAIYSSTGSYVSDYIWGGGAQSTGYGLIATSDGGYAITGIYASDSLFLAKYTSDFYLSWVSSWNGASQEWGYSLVQTSDGGYAVAGKTTSSGAGGSDILVIRFDAAGTVVWSRTWGGTGADSAQSIVQTADGGFAVAGTTANFGAGSTDGIILKYDSAGNIAGCSSPKCQTPSASSGLLSETMDGHNTGGTGLSGTLTSASGNEGSPSAVSSFDTAKSIWGTKGPGASAPLAAQDAAAASVRHDDPLRLRVILKNSKSALPAASSLKLQVSPRVGTCDTSYTGETYVDLSGSVAFNYYNNSNLASGDWAERSSLDPTAVSGPLYYGNYAESTGFTNRRHIIGTQNALFDISLAPTDSAVYGSYCFRVVQSDNSPLTSYTRIFELSIPPAAQQQMRHGKFFDEQGASGKQPLYW
jgi:uncharacterized delta-60 repeat protein